jgi:hypothetical protein
MVVQYQDPAMQLLGEQTRAMALSVTAFLKTVQSVEDSASRVEAALQTAIDTIAAEATCVAEEGRLGRMEGRKARKGGWQEGLRGTGAHWVGSAA